MLAKRAFMADQRASIDFEIFLEELYPTCQKPQRPEAAQFYNLITTVNVDNA